MRQELDFAALYAHASRFQSDDNVLIDKGLTGKEHYLSLPAVQHDEEGVTTRLMVLGTCMLSHLMKAANVPEGIGKGIHGFFLEPPIAILLMWLVMIYWKMSM